MFESLGDRLQEVLHKAKGYGKITEENIDEMMREIRLSLLEADVNYKVVKEFTTKVKEKALGEEVKRSIKPGDLFVKIVKDELTELLGGEAAPLNLEGNPAILMLVGLQGSGKTTTIGKLANYLRKKYKKKPLLVAGDIYRPAAIDQLKTLGAQLNIPVFSKGTDTPVETIVTEALAKARDDHNDVVIIDTAGRLQIDEKLMQELANVKEIAHPNEILLVVDSLAGQEIVNVASTFNDRLGITGAVLTKLDGDTRGGAALSIKAVTGKPILYIGMGEKLSDLEQFYPDRMASRILGMGDVLTLIEKVQADFDEEKAKEMERKLKKSEFDFNDYLESFKQVKKLGGIGKMLNMMPGMNSQMKNAADNVDEKQIARVEAIIYSMTPAERANPKLLNPSRKNRIARGAGVDIAEVNRLVKQQEQMKKMMKQLPGMMGGKFGKKGRFNLPF